MRASTAHVFLPFCEVVCTAIATLVSSFEIDSTLLTCDLRWEIA